MSAEKSKVIKHRADGWEGVEVGSYKTGEEDRHAVARHVLVGEREDEQAASGVTRYFEIAPSGYTTLERHEHAHTVVVLRGRGHVVLGEERHTLAPFDCVYVAPGTTHQFEADRESPLGFLCIVDRDRDRPQPLSSDEIERLTRLGVEPKSGKP